MEHLKKTIELLPGWMSVSKAEVLHNLILESKAKLSVEVGCFGMRGALAMGSAHQKVGGSYIGIDAYSSEPCLEGTGNPENDKYWRDQVDFNDAYYKGMNAVLSNGLIEWVNIVKMRSEKVASLIKNIDVLYLDGNASEEISTRDVQYYGPLVNEGGYLVLPNTDWQTKQKAKDTAMAMGFELVQSYTENCCGEFSVYKKTNRDNYSPIVKAVQDMHPEVEHQIPLLFQKLEGWMSERKAYTLYNLIVDSKAQVSAEIGFFGMRGSVAMALAHKKVGGCHYALDPLCVESAIEGDNDPENNEWWANKVDFEAVLRKGYQVLIDEKLTQWCNILRLKSEEAFYLFKGIDVLHIDGSHSSVAFERDVQYYAPLINPGKYIICDDTNWQQTQHGQEMLLNYGFVCIHTEDDPAGTQWKIYQKIES